MTVTLNLKADEVQVLQEIAQTTETTVEAVLHALIAQAALFRSAEAPAAAIPDARTETSAAAAERRREQEEVEANIRRWHQEQKAA